MSRVLAVAILTILAYYVSAQSPACLPSGYEWVRRYNLKEVDILKWFCSLTILCTKHHAIWQSSLEESVLQPVSSLVLIDFWYLFAINSMFFSISTAVTARFGPRLCLSWAHSGQRQLLSMQLGVLFLIECMRRMPEPYLPQVTSPVFCWMLNVNIFFRC